MSTTTPQPRQIPAVDKTRWRIDPARSSVEFRTPTFWGLVTVKAASGYDAASICDESPAIDLTIEAARLDTKTRTRCATSTCARLTSSTS